ncbi:MAG TPA: urease accessory UreF family protein [Nitrospira sp.]|nr:urease accessory UreF family protein [Nitrospira sp.]
MKTLALVNGFRFIDSFFPSGGFAFSSGLEAAVHDGAVRDGDGLARYVEEILVQGIAKREAVAVARAHRSEKARRIQAAMQVDAELESLKLGRDSRLASRQMGRQVARIAADHMPGHRLLREFGAAVENGRTPGHVPVAMGLTLAACGWSRQQAVAAFLYQTAQGFVSAAMKLLPVGQQQGQALLSRWAPLIADLSRSITPGAGLAAWSPLHDIYAMRHARLESRLFRS